MELNVLIAVVSLSGILLIFYLNVVHAGNEFSDLVFLGGWCGPQISHWIYINVLNHNLLSIELRFCLTLKL